MPDVVLQIEVVYARPERQRLIALAVEPGCTAIDGVRRSGILEEFPEIDPSQLRVGIWGRVVEAHTAQLRGGDRVEIYRPLLIDPKVVRQARADARAIKPKRLR